MSKSAVFFVFFVGSVAGFTLREAIIQYPIPACVFNLIDAILFQ